MDRAHKENKLCVIFAGSYTWPPYRDSMPDYLEFA